MAADILLRTINFYAVPPSTPSSSTALPTPSSASSPSAGPAAVTGGALHSVSSPEVDGVGSDSLTAGQMAGIVVGVLVLVTVLVGLMMFAVKKCRKANDVEERMAEPIL